METVEVRIYESRIVFDADGNPVRQPGKQVGTDQVSGDTVDARLRAAKAKVRDRFGKLASVSCATDGSLVANFTRHDKPPKRRRSR